MARKGYGSGYWASPKLSTEEGTHTRRSTEVRRHRWLARESGGGHGRECVCGQCRTKAGQACKGKQGVGFGGPELTSGLVEGRTRGARWAWSRQFTTSPWCLFHRDVIGPCSSRWFSWWLQLGSRPRRCQCGRGEAIDCELGSGGVV
jgi:hypothetical protein